MIIKLHNIIGTALVVGSLSLQAQDIHFSQFNENPSLLNPALTGASSVMRVSAVYRDQWRSVTVPYKTYGVSFESRFKASAWNKVDGQSMTFTKKATGNLTGGLSFYSDKAGDGNMGTTNVNLSLASFVPLNQKSFISLGLQGSLVQRSLDFTKLIFSNQYTGTGYDNTMISGENPANSSFIYADFAGGMAYTYATQDKMIASNNQKKATFGFSVYHINQPKQLFLNGSGEKMNMKYVVHGDFLMGIKHSNVAIAPAFLVQIQGAAKEIIVGTKIKYYIKEDSKYTGIIQRTSVDLGVFYRNQDAMIISFMYDKRQKMAIGISYDLNISSLTKASKLSGGPELVLRFNTSNPYLYQKKAKVD